MIEPGIYPNITHAEYHAMDEYVSNSYLGRLDHCPASAKVPVKETPAMTFGRAYHSFILDGDESFRRDYAVIQAEIDRRTKAGKQEYETFLSLNKGKTVISQDDFDTIGAMYSALVIHPIASVLLQRGRSEQSIFWVDQTTQIPCKVRPDRIPDGDHGVILDLKTVSSANLSAFTRQCMTFGYAREAGMYIEGFNAVSNIKVDSFIFITQEKDEPYRIEVYTLEDMFTDYGKSEFHRLLGVEKDCREQNFWPHWKSDEIRTIHLPNYVGSDM